MKRMSWQAFSGVTIGLALLTLAVQAPAGFPGCCLRDCMSGVQCIPGDPTACLAMCSDGLNETCRTAGFNSSCAQVAECAGLVPAAAAPVVGPTGLTVVALLLGGFGIYQAARRSRRGSRD